MAPARVAASETVLSAIREMDNGFEDVFEAVMKDAWYSRSVPDYYGEIMGARFIKLEDAIRLELSSAI